MAKIIVKSGSGSELGLFNADATQTITSFGAEAGILIPVACGVGACGICIADIESGAEFLNKTAFGSEGFPVTEEQVLTCIASVKADAPSNAEIILSLPNA